MVGSRQCREFLNRRKLEVRSLASAAAISPRELNDLLAGKAISDDSRARLSWRILTWDRHHQIACEGQAIIHGHPDEIWVPDGRVKAVPGTLEEEEAERYCSSFFSERRIE